MKKVLLMMLAVASLGFVACDGTKEKAHAKVKGADKEVLYSGILPAADAQGTMYTLMLEFDADHNYTDGDFTMVESSLVSDTVAAAGIKDVAVGFSKGDFKKASKQVGGETVEYITLTPDRGDVLGAASSDATYFIVNADQSLTMVGADLVKSEVPGLNYTLTVR